MCKHDAWNQKFITKNTESFIEYSWTEGKVEVSVKTEIDSSKTWFPADIKFELPSSSNKLEFLPGSYHVDKTNRVSHVDLDAILDTIEKINYKVSCLQSFDKNIELYLYKHYTHPVDEVNWDSTTNPFDYIIKQQFFK